MVKKLVTVGAVAVGAGFYLKKKYGEKIHQYAVDAASKIVDKEFEKRVREYNEHQDNDLDDDSHSDEVNLADFAEKHGDDANDADNDINLYDLFHGIIDNFEDLTETANGQLPEVTSARPEYALDLDTLLWLRKEFNLSDKVIDDILEEGVDTFEVLPVIVPKDVYVDAAVLYAGDNTEPVYQDASKVFNGDEK